MKRYGERHGRFADSKASEGRRRLEMAATDLWFLVQRFREDTLVAALSEFSLLERLLAEQSRIDEDEAIVVLKEGKEIPSDSLQSPFDPDASYDGRKGVGYQAQISETCEEDNPIQVITRIEVEPAHESDQHAIIPALDDLEARKVAPEKMYADTAYNSGNNLLDAAERGVDLVAPTPGKVPESIELGHFDLDLEKYEVRACPEGAKPIRSKLGKDGRTMNLHFDAERCAACPLVDDCPAGRQGGRLRVHPKDIATAYSRAREETEEFKQEYVIRSGGESINAALKTAHGLGKVWTRRLFRVAFAVKMKALASNVKRFLRYQCAQIAGKAEKTESVPA
ncbi:transposase [Magnetococcales bacterium HHB-1]